MCSGDVADVLVADGFTGNIALKLIEGVSSQTLKLLRDAAGRSLRAKVGGFLLKPSIKGLREEIDPEVDRRRLHARPAADRHRLPRPLHPPRVRARDRGRGARSRGGRDRRTRAALEEAGALRRPGGRLRGRNRCKGRGTAFPVRAWGYGCWPMTREQILSAIRAHLADELEIDPASIERDAPASGRIWMPTRSISTRSSRSSRTATA